MALKYYFEFTDVQSILHRVEILDATFTGNSTQIFGSCSLEYSETDDTLEAVRGSGLQIDLDANSNLTFYDLYSEEERTFSVVYVRDSTTLFNGWLSPEGIYESLVSDKWVISLDCTDGLGFLSNLSYVEDATGLPFSGKQSALEIITNCLKRTKTPQNILTSVKIYYDGLDQQLNTFVNVYFNSNRFLKEDDGETIMNCEEVLKSVLEPFGAVITSYKGEWLIYKPNSLFDFSSQIFFQYNSDGVALATTVRRIDFAFDLGSQIDNYYPHHVNANQQKTIKSSIGAYRINYKYGLVSSLLVNEFLNINSGVLTGYTILNSNAVTLGSEKGFTITKDPTTPFNVLETVGDTVNLATELTLTFVHKSTSTEVTSARISLQLEDNGTFYHCNGGNWLSGTGSTLFRSLSLDVTSVINTPPTPVAGVVKVIILTNNVFVPPGEDPPFTDQQVEYISIKLEPTKQGLIEGENHTFQRTLKPSSKIKDTKKVFNADNPADIYLGTIYKADQTTPTSVWTRQGASETKPILRIMGEERMKMYAKPLQVYSGDVYGYFNYLSLVTINNLTGKFMPTKYNYNAFTNVTSLELTEVLNSNILSDVLYELTFDYGNVVEPTIKG
tara:strand:- start:1479 stop:3320 length:1842 start_codon:yes stop_codon:yes gene_type:complete